MRVPGPRIPPSLPGAVISQVHIDDIRLTINQIEAMTGATTRWSGNIFIEQTRCVGQSSALRLESLELRYSHSSGLSQRSLVVPSHNGPRRFPFGQRRSQSADYIAYKGWEEGVEWKQFARWVAPQIGLSLPSPIIVVHHGSYSEHVRNLQVLRGYTNKTEEEFFINLLNTPLADRPPNVALWIRHHTTDPGALRRRLRSFAIRSANLRR